MGKRGKTEKMSVTLPRELASEIRSIASQGEVSSFFTEALEHYIAYHKQKIALEILTSIKRAGADLILTYFAKDVAKWLNE